MTSKAQQRLAHTLIRASAGTGKTFQLSNRYLALAADGQALDSILAATFTRKAAGEILDRILTRLAEAALDPVRAAELARHVGRPALDARQCLALLRQMVRHLHRIRTGTLDSFFLQIAKSFALELQLPLGWQILDDVYDTLLRGEAIRAVLRKETTGDVVRMMNLLTKGDAARSVSQQIHDLVKELYGLYTETSESAWQCVPRMKPLTPVELAAAVEAAAAIPLSGKQLSDTRNKDLDAVRVGDWQSLLKKGVAKKVFEGADMFGKTKLSEDLINAYQPLLRHAKAMLLGQIANQTEATWHLLQRFDEAYRRLKDERRALRFEDVTRRLAAADVAARLEDVVYRLDAHVAHLLLDEFQDTSPPQWRVVSPFARVVTENPAGSFFCVGDVKQAIYGWRGGVAEIFETLREELPNLELQSLNQSFRSSPVVIDTVNRVFENLAANVVLQDHREAAARWGKRFATHSTALSALPGYCRMIAAPPAPEGEKQTGVTLAFAADEIERIHGEAPGCSLGVLVRRNAAVARLIFELRRRKIEASEEGGNPLVDSPAVQLVLSLLTLADHPGSRTARFHVANSSLGPKLGLPDHADDAAAWRLAQAVRSQLLDDGYGRTLYGWAAELAGSCDRRDLNRLMQLVELAYAYENSATTRPDDFVRLVRQKRVEDPTSAPVRVMNVHQSKGLQFDIVVLPELDARLAGQPPQVVVGRPTPSSPAERVCRYVSKELRSILPRPLQDMFEAHHGQVVQESLCLLYVAMTRAIHALHLIVSPSKESEKRLSATFAGLLRAALADGARAEPGKVLYEHGDPRWHEKLPPAAATAAVTPPAPTVVRLAAAPVRPLRGLDRRSPSQLEGGGPVRLEQQLQLETKALDRGTLVHAWFALVEWLDDGEPDDRALNTIAADPRFRALDVPSLKASFRQAIQKPAIRAALIRTTYATSQGGAASNAIQAAPTVARPRWDVWRERPFAVRDGDAILSGTFDRLVTLYDGDQPVGADVLDYKTDVVAADEAALESRVEFYRPQLLAYRKAAAALLGLDASRITARLAFLEPGIVRNV